VVADVPVVEVWEGEAGVNPGPGGPAQGQATPVFLVFRPGSRSGILVLWTGPAAVLIGGGSDHVMAVCRNRPHCPSCAERGQAANHKPGSAGCAPVYCRRDSRQSPPSQSRGGGKVAATRSGGAAGVPASARSSADTEIIPGRAEDGGGLTE